ncbi:MAG: nucleotidyltransferase domain-containing protein [Planctomycetota bacterium]
MKLTERDKKAIAQFCEKLRSVFNKRLSHVLVFGSRVRGFCDPMSDIDILVVIKDLTEKEEYAIWDLAGDVSLDCELIFSIAAYDEHDFYRRDELPFIMALLEEGVEYEI